MFHYAVVSWLIRSDKIIEQITFFEKNSFVRAVLKPYFLWITNGGYFVRGGDRGGFHYDT